MRQIYMLIDFAKNDTKKVLSVSAFPSIRINSEFSLDIRTFYYLSKGEFQTSIFITARGYCFKLGLYGE